ncbi:MAG: CHASE3 domain-containing protein, partial [Deltaproteobacteria bacterium]|nr:CHASE3 domain-containing protein [Kofleriaceae bacterium]
MPNARVERDRSLLPPKSLSALLTVLAALFVITALTYQAQRERIDNARALSETTSTRNALNRIVILVERAQGGQRGFLITGDETLARHIDVAVAEVPARFTEARDLVRGEPEIAGKLDTVEKLVHARLGILDESLRVYRAGNVEGARDVVRSGRGRIVMDQVRVLVDEILAATEARLARSTATWNRSASRASYVTFGGAGVMVSMLFLVGFLASRDFRTVGAESWVRRVQLALGGELQGDMRLESLGEKVLGALVPNLGAEVGAMYVRRGEGMRRVAAHALAAEDAARVDVAAGEGIVGQAFADGEVVHLSRVPEGYLTIASGTGRTRPGHVVIAPCRIDGRVEALIELGFLRDVDPVALVALERVGETIGGAFRTARDRSRLEELLEETQRQAEELQTQQEELRVSNEELEQQSRALQLSQAQLENQQAELEQVNAQLEEQTASLERQRDDLARTGAELQRTTEYKSQFLANMSHELRTPLNSALILAKLLADNKNGNLDAEQVQFASTIYTAGNDLLTLINDILDLSKIEAGMLDVRSERIVLERMLEELRQTFAPVAAQRQLALELALAPGVPEAFESDALRLQQILRNLLSNALKFTEQGGVTVEVTRDADTLAFAVRDTGIGVPVDQHDAIFEPFRQADGASTRKFGGTGLGLSISRDLARLLGGDLRLTSAPGQGSTFTLTVPLAAPARTGVPARAVAPATTPA